MGLIWCVTVDGSGTSTLTVPSSDFSELLQEHAPGDYAPAVKPSAKGNYHSVSVAVTVTSKEHMELIYTELAKIELVRVVL